MDRPFVIFGGAADDRRRTKVMQTLLDFGRRVQYSVFECDLKAKDLDRLLKKLGRLVDKTEDSVRFYFLCESCLPLFIFSYLLFL